MIITLLGVVLGGVITLLSSRYFPKSEYGFTLNLINIVTHLSLFSLLGFTSTLLVIGQKYPIGHQSRSSFLAVCAAFPLFFSIVVTIAFFAFKPSFLSLYHLDDRQRMEEYFILFPIFTLLSVAISWLEGYLQSLNKTAIQSFAREILVRVIYITLIVLYATGVLDYSAFIWLFVLLYAVPLLFLLRIARKSGGFSFKFEKGAFDTHEIKEILRFSGYHMLTILSSILILQLSVILLGPLASDGLESVAVYTVASFVIAVLRNPMRVMGVASTPTFSKTYHEGRLSDLKTLFTRSTVNMQIFGIASFALIYLNIDAIQQIMSLIQEGYGAIKGIILILMVGQFADMITGFNYELISITKYYKFNFWIALGILILVFILNYFLILEHNVFGAAWATTIGLFIFNIIKSGFLWRKLKMQPFNKATAIALGIGIAAAVLAWLMPTINNVFMDVALRSALFSSIFLYGITRFKLSKELNDLLSNILSNKRLY